MLTWLRKTFIRNYEDIGDKDVRSAHGVLSSVIGIVLNVILVGLKLTAALLLAANNGWVISLVLIGDSLNNAFDIASSITSFIGFKLAKKPADKDHPFGHARAEYVAGVVIATAIIFTAATLAFRSVESLLSQADISYDLLAFIALGATIPIKFLQGYVNLRLAKLLSSPTLKGVALDSFTDMGLSTLLLVGALLSRFLAWPYLDGYLGLVVAVFLAINGVRILKEACDPLLGKAMSHETEDGIKEACFAHNGVLGVHDVLCHTYGEGVTFITLHIEVDPTMSLIDAHDLADEVEVELSNTYKASVTVHVDPRVPYAELKGQIASALMRVDKRLTFHDIHAEKDAYHIDVVVPFECDDDIQDKVKEELNSLGVTILVTFDHPYSD